MPGNTDTTDGHIQPGSHGVFFQMAMADSEGLELPARAEVLTFVPAPRYTLLWPL